MYSVVVLAAGSGSRMNLGYNKMFHQIGDAYLINLTIAKFLENNEVNEIIVTVSDKDLQSLQEIIIKDEKIVLIKGGNERQDSVYNALCYLEEHSTNEYVLVHDGARCNISSELIDKCLTTINTTQKDAYVVAVPEKNTIHEVVDGKIKKILNRDCLYAMQTPQIAKINVLYECLKLANEEGYLATDEVAVLNHYDYNVDVITGEYRNIKVTTIEDLGVINE